MRSIRTFARARTNAQEARLKWRATSAPEHKQYLDGIERQMKEWGLRRRVSLPRRAGPREKIEFLQTWTCSLSLRLTMSRKECFCLKRWLAACPSVQPRRGAFPEIIEKTGGGMLVEPGRLASSLARDYCRYMKNPSLQKNWAARDMRRGRDALQASQSHGRPRARSVC